MILSRLAEHLRKQRWTSVAIELVIVVLGVFIGLQAQDWSRQRDNRASETRLVADLLADLGLDRDNYAGALKTDKRVITSANASLVGAGLQPIQFDEAASSGGLATYALNLAALPGFPEDQRERMWTGVVIGYFPRPSTATYDAMAGAGDFKIIRDRDLVRDIQIYHSLTDSVSAQNDKLLGIRATTLGIGARHGLAPFQSMPVASYLRLVADTPQLAAAIRIQATFAIYHHGEIRSADARAEQLEGRLKAFLGSSD